MQTSKLLAIILHTGTKGQNAEELSRSLLSKFPTLREMDRAAISRILEIRGIGPAKAARVKAALEIGKRLCRETASAEKPIRNPGDALAYVRDYFGPYLRDAAREIACLILLNTKNRPIKALEIARGTLDAVYADPKKIVREALDASASSVLLVHNHPSGDAEPSEGDIVMTRSVKEACALFGIRVLDHVVIGRNPPDYRSFMEEGLL